MASNGASRDSVAAGLARDLLLLGAGGIGGGFMILFSSDTGTAGKSQAFYRRDIVRELEFVLGRAYLDSISGLGFKISLREKGRLVFETFGISWF